LKAKFSAWGDDLQMIRVPAGIDAASVVELLALRDRAAQELPSQPVGVAVLGLGHAAVRRGCPHELPARPEFGMGRFEDGEVEETLQLRTPSCGPAAVC
jgi:hypothetical protein